MPSSTWTLPERAAIEARAAEIDDELAQINARVSQLEAERRRLGRFLEVWDVKPAPEPVRRPVIVGQPAPSNGNGHSPTRTEQFLRVVRMHPGKRVAEIHRILGGPVESSYDYVIANRLTLEGRVRKVGKRYFPVARRNAA